MLGRLELDSLLFTYSLPQYACFTIRTVTASNVTCMSSISASKCMMSVFLLNSDHKILIKILKTGGFSTYIIYGAQYYY